MDPRHYGQRDITDGTLVTIRAIRRDDAMLSLRPSKTLTGIGLRALFSPKKERTVPSSRNSPTWISVGW
jgi:hypothetical protein